jgi:hypothetical protein
MGLDLLYFALHPSHLLSICSLLLEEMRGPYDEDYEYDDRLAFASQECVALPMVSFLYVLVV